MSEKTKEQEELETRARLFDKEFQALQRKYMFRVVAQHVWPAHPGTQPAITNIPITLVPIVDLAPKKPDLVDINK